MYSILCSVDYYVHISEVEQASNCSSGSCSADLCIARERVKGHVFVCAMARLQTSLAARPSDERVGGSRPRDCLQTLNEIESLVYSQNDE